MEKPMLVLRTCQVDKFGRATSYRGTFNWPVWSKTLPDGRRVFQWNPATIITAPDWDGGKEKYGGGLHGILWGIGNSDLLDWSDDAVWLVCVVVGPVTKPFYGKVKFKKCRIAYAGDRSTAAGYLAHRGADPSKMILGQATASGDRGQATASGDRGQATASGDRGQATASGYLGQATASGYLGQATASGDWGQATASGDLGQATASGDRGQATASGYRGQATASGDLGQATASGYLGQATAGEQGVLIVFWYDRAADRMRVTVGYPGEDGIKAHVPYRCDDAGKLVEVVAEEGVE